MKTITLLRATTGMAALLVGIAPTQLWAQTNTTDLPSIDAADEGEDIIVNGVRQSLATAADRKKNAKQIKDVIVSEDVGKLPDNNVPEALSRVTGIQIDRAHGEGSGLSIRGLGDVQTTINGNSNSVGESRSANLADIPAELLKSVEVYKTRTADQVEGGIAGTVNVELRRPLDLKKGLTLAGSFREIHNDIGKTWSPYASLLVGGRWETGIGEMGLLLNGSYTQNRYEDSFIESESPGTFFGATATRLTPAEQEYIVPYAVNYGIERGKITRPSLNASFQWKPSDRLDFVLEGAYIGSKEERSRERLNLQIRGDNYNLSQIVLQPDGKTIKSVTLTSANPADPFGLVGGPQSYTEEVKSNNYTTNFETHWRGDSVQINASAQYNWSDWSNYGILQNMRLNGQTTATIDFDSPNIPSGGPYISFPGNLLGDIKNYGLFLFHDESTTAKTDELSGQVDLTVQTSATGLFRSFQSGVRYSRRNTSRDYGYRDAFPNIVGGQFFPLTSFPYGSEAVTITPNIRGFDSPSWFALSGKTLFDNLDSVRQYLVANVANGGGQFTTERPSNNQGQSYITREETFAAYAQFNYAFKLLFPIDGVIGARAVNTWGFSQSTIYKIGNTGETTEFARGRGNYLDVLPSANAIVHFDAKTQLRLAYTRNVTRPSFYDIRPFAVYIQNATPVLAFAGNPDLKAVKGTNYDISLEHYFGRGGVLSAAAFLKNQDGAFYYDRRTNQFIPDLGVVGTVEQVRNAGKGQVQGLEFNAQSFFDFMPGFAKNFGASANLSYFPIRKQTYTVTVDAPTATNPQATELRDIELDAPYTSKYTYNLALYYDTPVFYARVAYNYRSSRSADIYTPLPEYTLFTKATSRLDAAINLTPVKFMTLSLEATNLLRNNDKTFWGKGELLPQGLRIQPRTVQMSARFRF